MSIIHKSTFPVEALDKLQAAAEAATEVEGVRGYRILRHPDARTLIMHLEVESKDTFNAIQAHDGARAASEALWEAHPPHAHEMFEVHSQSY
jgi:divalent metal cation (Fe/Co/Zn/Cd) transporter